MTTSHETGANDLAFLRGIAEILEMRGETDNPAEIRRVADRIERAHAAGAGLVPDEVNEWPFDAQKHMRGDYAYAAGWNACRAAMLSAAPDPKPAPSDALEDLISEYWRLAYAEGKEGRTHDTEDGAAQRKWSEIQAAIRQLAPVPAQGAEGVEALADAIYATANQFDSHRGGLPEDYLEWAEDVARRLRDHVAAARRLRNSPQLVETGDAMAKAAIAVHGQDGRGMIGANRRHLQQRVARAIQAERLRNSPESPDGSFSLLSLLADIRAAAGDPTGKLMQEELVVHIRALRNGAERYKWLKDNGIIRVFPMSSGRTSRGGSRILANTIEWIKGDFTYVIDGITRDVDAAIDAARSAGGDDEA